MWICSDIVHICIYIYPNLGLYYHLSLVIMFHHHLSVIIICHQLSSFIIIDHHVSSLIIIFHHWSSLFHLLKKSIVHFWHVSRALVFWVLDPLRAVLEIGGFIQRLLGGHGRLKCHKQSSHMMSTYLMNHMYIYIYC